MIKSIISAVIVYLALCFVFIGFVAQNEWSLLITAVGVLIGLGGARLAQPQHQEKFFWIVLGSVVLGTAILATALPKSWFEVTLGALSIMLGQVVWVFIYSESQTL